MEELDKIYPLGVAFAVVIGYALRGRLRNLANVKLRHWWMVWIGLFVQIGLALQLGFGYLPINIESVSFWVLLASYLLIAIWIISNILGKKALIRLGLAVVALGWLLQFAVIAANRGMPVSLTAMKAVGLDTTVPVDEGARSLRKHVPYDSDTKLGFLADVIPLPGLRQVASAGDFLLILGIMEVIVAGMRQEAASPSPPSA